MTFSAALVEGQRERVALPAATAETLASLNEAMAAAVKALSAARATPPARARR
jgi:hypothetical protein